MHWNCPNPFELPTYSRISDIPYNNEKKDSNAINAPKSITPKINFANLVTAVIYCLQELASKL